MENSELIIFILKIVIGLVVGGVALVMIVQIIQSRINAYLKLKTIEDDFAEKKLNSKLFARHSDYVKALENRNGEKLLDGQVELGDLDDRD